jgi:hypothetical protein
VNRQQVNVSVEGRALHNEIVRGSSDPAQAWQTCVCVPQDWTESQGFGHGVTDLRRRVVQSLGNNRRCLLRKQNGLNFAITMCAHLLAGRLLFWPQRDLKEMLHSIIRFVRGANNDFGQMPRTVFTSGCRWGDSHLALISSKCISGADYCG